ncbi:MAG: hypothetical protein GC181_10005 [Bacteroidetes bacterium]|nr:hypothetical protein [Bacteroidota bacterium]
MKNIVFRLFRHCLFFLAFPVFAQPGIIPDNVLPVDCQPLIPGTNSIFSNAAIMCNDQHFIAGISHVRFVTTELNYSSAAFCRAFGTNAFGLAFQQFGYEVSSVKKYSVAIRKNWNQSTTTGLNFHESRFVTEGYSAVNFALNATLSFYHDFGKHQFSIVLEDPFPAKNQVYQSCLKTTLAIPIGDTSRFFAGLTIGNNSVRGCAFYLHQTHAKIKILIGVISMPWQFGLGIQYAVSNTISVSNSSAVSNVGFFQGAQLSFQK